MSAINPLRDQLASLRKLSEETTARLLAFDANYGKHPQLSDEEQFALYDHLEKLASMLATSTSQLEATIALYDSHGILRK